MVRQTVTYAARDGGRVRSCTGEGARPVRILRNLIYPKISAWPWKPSTAEPRSALTCPRPGEQEGGPRPSSSAIGCMPKMLAVHVG